MSYMNLFLTNRFETILADTEHSQGLHFGFRYKVFCEETGFEQASAFPDKKERDEYDPHSAHFFVWDRLHKNVAGAMRLVDACETTLPIEEITSNRLHVPVATRRGAIEFSRLCVNRSCARLHPGIVSAACESQPTTDGDTTSNFFHQERNEILLRLVRAIIAWSQAREKVFCYFLTTKALARVLEREKVHLEIVGASVSHRGDRYPYVADIPGTHQQMTAHNSVYRWLLDRCQAFVRASTLEASAYVHPADVAAGGFKHAAPVDAQELATSLRTGPSRNKAKVQLASIGVQEGSWKKYDPKMREQADAA